MALLPWQLVALRRALRGCDLAWVQVSNLPEACFVVLARLAGSRVLVTPHFGANSKLVTHRVVRPLVRMLLGRAHRIALLFAGRRLKSHCRAACRFRFWARSCRHRPLCPARQGRRRCRAVPCG
jgi:hypothetical protein